MIGRSPNGLGLAAFERGLTAQQEGRIDDAIAAYRKAIRQTPGLAPAQFNLGQLLRERRDYAGAAACFEGAARLRPTAADAWLNLGAMLERCDRHQEAIEAYGRAAVCAPEDPVGEYNRGNVLLALGDYPGAAAAFRAAIERSPAHLDSQWNLATALLGMGDLANGWPQYEWRWAKRGVQPADRFRWPLWSGEPVADRRLLVWREQGLGDELLFATCVRELMAGGAEVTLAVSPRLVSLFERAFPGVTVIEDGKWRSLSFDFHIPAGSLPRYLRSTRASFPLESRYLVPLSSHATRWVTRLERLGAGPKVGICWRSGLLTEDRVHQYSSLEDWSSLFELPGIHWINLQYDECGAELERAERRFDVKIHRWPDENLRDDLESVVGLLWNLDAVVTAATAVCSFAGAAGVRTWQVDAGTDWTALGEKRSPWFPTVRLARRRPGTTDWQPALQEIARELALVRPPEPVG